MRKFTTFLFSVVGIFCIVYYFSKFYANKGINYNEIELIRFTIISTIVIISLVIGVFNYIKLEKLQKENTNLINKVIILSKTIEKFHYSEMSAIKDNMECILDLDKGEKDEFF